MLDNIPDVHAGDREIPAGKVLIWDKRLPDDAPRAIPAVLDTRTAWEGRRKVDLVACPAGWACAGSVMRWDNGWYGIRYWIDGSIHGRRFREFSDALAAFNALPA